MSTQKLHPSLQRGISTSRRGLSLTMADTTRNANTGGSGAASAPSVTELAATILANEKGEMTYAEAFDEACRRLTPRKPNVATIVPPGSALRSFR